MYKLGFKEAEEPEVRLPTFLDHGDSERISEKNIYFCFIDYTKAFDCVDHNRLWKRDGRTRPSDLSLNKLKLLSTFSEIYWGSFFFLFRYEMFRMHHPMETQKLQLFKDSFLMKTT